MARRDHRNRIAALPARASCAYVIAALAVAWCASARADELSATQLFRHGIESLRASDYAAAAAAFRRSYALSARPSAVCNLALTYDRWEAHAADAADAYERCAAADTTGRLREHALARAASLRASVGSHSSVVDRPDSETPTPDPTQGEPLRVSPPPPATVTPTPMARPAALPGPSPREQSTAAPRRPLYKAWWLWTAVTVTTVAAVVIGVELGTQHGPKTSLGSFGPNALSLRF